VGTFDQWSRGGQDRRRGDLSQRCRDAPLVPLSMRDDEVEQKVQAAVRTLKAVLPSRVGPKAAADVLRSMARMKELGTPPLTMLQALSTTIDTFAVRPAIAAPWSSAMCRAMLTVAPKKLSSFSLFAPSRGLPDVVVAGCAQHASALLPAFGDLDFALGVAWQNLLTFHAALVVGACFDRNSTSPIEQLYDACVDAHLADDDVPMAVIPRRGVLVARGHVPPRDDVAWTPREVQVHLWGKGRQTVGIAGDGSFLGVRGLIAELGVPLDVPHLPALLALATLPCDPRTAIIDVDGQMSALAKVEAELEPGVNAAAARLGIASSTTIAVPSPLRFRVGTTSIALHDSRGICVAEID
jgi:hypothetical protein